EGVFQFDGEATFSGAFLEGGEVCVRLTSGGQTSNTICQPLEVIREDVWGTSTAAWYPGEFTNRNVTLALSNGIYVGFGEQNEWFQFDPETWSWTEKSNLPFVNFEAYTGFEIDNIGYIFGQNGFIYRYDESSDTWTEVTEFQEDLTTTFRLEQWSNVQNFTNFLYPFVGTSIGGKGYFGVGGTGRFFEFDPNSNQIREVASYPAPGLQDANYFVWNDKLYLGAYRYDPSFDTWEDASARYSFDNYDKFFAVLDDGVYFLSGNTTFRFDGKGTEAYQPRPLSNAEIRIGTGITQGATFKGITFFPKYFRNGNKLGLFPYFIKN
ncbi:MAG: hypothetical protein KI790_21025, partial [Cyclobacteriaceae bacterium]|nr:hypothetical protein [Cyclobacteriaceae bacterium HetDA_MAG_MS6]